MTPWSAQQREWLQAMGHDVLMLASAEAMDDLAAPPSERPAQTAPVQRGQTTAASGDSPMLRAILRAAGRGDLGDLPWLPDPAALRGDAAAKRALWPRLRTLRRKPDDA